MSLEKYSNRFSKIAKSDLLVIYIRVTKSDQGIRYYLQDQDVKTVIELIESKVAELGKGLTLLLHLQGGHFQSALALVAYLRETYQEKILKSVVLNISKSSGTYLALACCDSYMDKSATLSDFSMNHNIASNTNDTIACMNIALNQYLKSNGESEKSANENAVAKFQKLINSKKHANNIYFTEATTDFGVKDFAEYGNGDWHLTAVHNELLIKFDDMSGINKIIGFNGSYAYC